MLQILEIFSFQSGYMGGVATMIDAYIKGKEEFAQNNCKLTHLNIAPTINTGIVKFDNIAYIFTQRKAVRKYLDKNHYDVVHIHTSREFLFLKDVLLAKMIRKRYNVRIMITIHVGSIHTVYNRIGWFKEKSIRLLNKYVDKVIFLSKVMSRDFIEAGLDEKRTVLLYNFYRFIPTEFVPSEEKEPLQLLYVGAIHREKGIMELLRALSEMANLNYHLNVCGKLTDNSIKNEVEQMKQLLGCKVSFLGYVTGEAKTRLFHDSDMLILPSYHEGLPLVIMEALGAGCAIMSTPVGSIPEILQDENCLWVDIASVESIKNQLKSLTENKLTAMKIANKELGQAFTFQEHVKTLAEIYNNEINDRQNISFIHTEL